MDDESECENDEVGGSLNSGATGDSFDSALSKLAISTREKLQDDTYAWVMKTVDLVFEYFPKKQDRDEPIEKLREVVEKFCIQDMEHGKSRKTFDKICRIYPVKKSPNGLDITEEYNKLLSKQKKFTKKSVQSHPKYIKFLERLKELERGKELSQTDAISVD